MLKMNESLTNLINSHNRQKKVMHKQLYDVQTNSVKMYGIRSKN